MRNLGHQPSQLGHGILLALEHDPSTREVQVQLVTRSQSERRTDFGWNDEATLLTENQGGIHLYIVPQTFM